MAKSKRSKHERAMRRLLREKLAKKDEAKRLAALKSDSIRNAATSDKTPSESDQTEQMQFGGSGEPTEFNMKTLKNKEGQFPSWLSGRQRKRLQAKHNQQKKVEKKKKMKNRSGKGKKDTKENQTEKMST